MELFKKLCKKLCQEKEKDFDFSRINGLQRPFNRLQVLSWVIFTIKVVSFYTIVAPAVYRDAAFYVSIQVIYGFLAVLVAIFAFKATQANTLDPIV
jgi:hypothetical protein